MYVVRCPTLGLYKIGASRDPAARLHALRAGHRGRHLVSAVPFEDHTHAEAALHVALRHRRVRGEWFDLDAADLALLAEPVRGGEWRPELVALFDSNKDAPPKKWGPSEPREKTGKTVTLPGPVAAAIQAQADRLCLPFQSVVILACWEYLAQHGITPDPIHTNRKSAD